MTNPQIFLQKHLALALGKHITNLVDLDGMGQLLVSAWTSGESWNHFIPNAGFDYPLKACIKACERAMRRLDRNPCFYLVEELGYAQLFQALHRHGYQAGAQETWMTYDLDKFTIPPKPGVDVKFWDGNLEGMERYIEVFNKGFGNLPPGYSRQLFLAMSRKAKNERYCYLEMKGECIAVGSFAFDGEYAGMYGSTVLPEFRGRGLGKYILQMRMAEIKALGCHFAFLQCEPESTGFFEQIGFESQFEGTFYTKPDPDQEEKSL